jgi:hypothetical protein
MEKSTSDNGGKMFNRVRVDCDIQMEILMKVIGLQGRPVVMVCIRVQMDSSFLKENGGKISNMDKDLSHGLMVASIKEGLKDQKRAE